MHLLYTTVSLNLSFSTSHEQGVWIDSPGQLLYLSGSSLPLHVKWVHVPRTKAKTRPAKAYLKAFWSASSGSRRALVSRTYRKRPNSMSFHFSWQVTIRLRV